MDMHSQRRIAKSILEMLCLEESPYPDWTVIFGIAENAIRFIVENELGEGFDSYVIKFFDDADIRSKDTGYGNYQRRKIRGIAEAILESGETQS
jgi:hypothetical protein